MKSSLLHPLLGLIILLAGCSSQTSQANDSKRSGAQKPNLLIMGEDFDKDSVPRDSRVFKRVFAAIDEQLNEVGFSVYDETAITLENFAQGRTRRPDAELIDIAKSITQPPIDVAVFFTIYASARDVGYTTQVKARVEGRLLNVRTGQRLGNFEMEIPSDWKAPPKCNRECILEVVGDYTRIIGADVGVALSTKLAWMVSPTGGAGKSGNTLVGGYTMIFDGFSPKEIMRFEEYMVKTFSGYQGHRPTYSSARRYDVWYESTIPTGRLNRNLNLMLEETGLAGIVQFSGNKFTIKKISLRGKPPAANDDGW